MCYFSCLAMEIKYKFRVPSVLPTSDMQVHIERFNNSACVPSTFVYIRHVKHDERNNLFNCINNNCKLKITKPIMQKLHKCLCTY